MDRPVRAPAVMREPQLGMPHEHAGIHRPIRILRVQVDVRRVQPDRVVPLRVVERALAARIGAVHPGVAVVIDAVVAFVLAHSRRFRGRRDRHGVVRGTRIRRVARRLHRVDDRARRSRLDDDRPRAARVRQEVRGWPTDDLAVRRRAAIRRSGDELRVRREGVDDLDVVSEVWAVVEEPDDVRELRPDFRCSGALRLRDAQVGAVGQRGGRRGEQREQCCETDAHSHCARVSPMRKPKGKIVEQRRRAPIR